MFMRSMFESQSILEKPVTEVTQKTIYWMIVRMHSEDVNLVEYAYHSGHDNGVNHWLMVDDKNGGYIPKRSKPRKYKTEYGAKRQMRELQASSVSRCWIYTVREYQD